MTEVKLKSGDSLEFALKLLRKRSVKTLTLARDRRYYEKPSEKKYKRKKKAKWAAKMQAKEDELWR